MAGLLSGIQGRGPENEEERENLPRPANDNVHAANDNVGAANDNTPGETPNVTPEEQAQYDQFVNNALEIVYPQQSQGQPSPIIMQSLAGQFSPEETEMLAEADPPISNNPIDNLAATGVSLVIMVEASASQAQAQIDDDVLFHAGADILAELAEVAEAAKIHDYSDEEMESSLYRALDIYRVSSPRADPQSLAEEFGQVVAADKSGQLDQVLPGITKRAA